jgi:hypothetical protein
MDMFVPVHMSRFVEPELEDNVFASVAIQVQAEGIQTLNVKGIYGAERTRSGLTVIAITVVSGAP